MSEPLKLCANCKTERFGIYCRGYCYRCYRLIVQKEQVERWDLKDPSTLKRFPSTGGYSIPREFPKIKAKRLRELKYRLWLLKLHERQRGEEVSGLHIEHALRRVAEWCGGNEDLLNGIASEVTQYFGPKQRQTLLGWLIDIEESMRWDPRRYWHALNPEEVERMAAQNRAEFNAYRARIQGSHSANLDFSAPPKKSRFRQGGSPC
jgi:hypothetical protein